MKKNLWITIITIITACCVIGGTVYHFGAWGVFPFRMGKMMSKNEDLETFAVVDADVNLMDVTITAGERFSVSCQYTNELLAPVYEIKKGTLYIKQGRYRSWGIGNNQCSLTLTIPAETAMDTVDVQTAMGDVHLKGITASKCELQSNMGDCTLQDCSLGETDLGTNMGEISVSNTSLGDVKTDSDMGDIKVTASVFDSLRATASMGDIRVDSAQELDGYDMELETDMGSVTVNKRDEGTKYHQSGDAGKLELETSMGSIHLTY